MSPVIKRPLDIDFVKNFIQETSSTTKIYVGCDSECYRKDGIWWADYTSVVVAHINGNRGCKIFGEVVAERLYDQIKKRPAHRLMMEVYKASEMYLRIEDAIGDRYSEIHLDINPKKKFASSIVIDQAIGYIRGTCNVVPLIKPDAFAASYAADRFKEISRVA